MNFKGFLLSMLASCCHGRNADKRQMILFCGDDIAAEFGELRQVRVSVSPKQHQPRARAADEKMVDAVHKRFNIDLHLEVGASRRFDRGRGRSGGTRRRLSARFSAVAYLVAVVSSTSRVATPDVVGGRSGSCCRCRNRSRSAAANAVSPARASPIRTAQRR